MARGIRRKGPSAALRYAFYLLALAAVLSWPVLSALYDGGYITLSVFTANASIALEMFFPLVVFSYLLAKGWTLKGIAAGLGLSWGRLNARNIIIGVALFVAILFVGYLISAFSQATGIPLPTNVQQLLAGMPFYFLVFTVLVAPVDEEILFRGFLVPRVGLVIGSALSRISSGLRYDRHQIGYQWASIAVSALLFALPHYFSYASVSEFIAAFAFGILAGYAFNRYKSLYATVLGHALVNLVTIVAILPW